MIDWFLAIIVACLMCVEIVLIISLLRLKKEVETLNTDMNKVFEELFAKIKAVVDLVLKVQVGKIEQVSVKGDKFEGDLKIKG